MTTNYLRGWHISNIDDVWYAHRHGVQMHTNSYDGIVRMILQKEQWWEILHKNQTEE